MVSTPLEEYRGRLDRRTQQRILHEVLYRRLSYARLAVGVAGVAVVAFSIGVEWISPVWLIVPVLVFVVLAIRHGAVDSRLTRATRAVAFYEKGLARLEDQWIGTGAQGAAFADPAHLYGMDLDLFGKGSLFELLSVCRTATGERALAGWLLKPGVLAEIRERQQWVAEIRPRLDLREDLALVGEDVRAAVDDRSLAEWGTRPAVRFFAGAQWIALGLALAALAAFAGYMAQVVSLRPFLYVILAEMIFAFTVREGVKKVTASVSAPARELELLAMLLERLEREPFEAPALAARFHFAGKNPTAQIRRLERLVDRMEWAHNMFFQPIAAPLLWVPQCAMAIERWRNVHGPHIGDWVAAIGEFEALSSLASFAYEHPAAVFPDLDESAAPVFEARALAHPLIPAARAVPNDVAIERLWIVSGSNMSGKSTLLRAVGLSAVLAWAGAPVTAGALRISRLNVGASLATHDSLADNRSRFYAEISRLRDIVNLARSGQPTMFLLDELLSGTNSHDRRIGAEAVIRGLLESGAIGMVTTHDLALAEMQIEGALNVHFEDHMEGDQIRFDYSLRPGVVRRGNALELMRAVGLDV